MKEETKEQLPAAIIDKMLAGKKVRVAIAQHPVTGELAPCIPYKDIAEVCTYDESAIRKIIHRTNCIKKYAVEVIMSSTDGKFYKTLCLFEEGVYGVTIKLVPSRCKDPEVAAHVDLRQEEMLIVLKDAYRGYHTGAIGYKSEDGKLPHPGLSMDAISELCREADKNLKGIVSLRALNYFTGMPVDDLVTKLESMSVTSTGLAGIMSQYLFALLSGDPAKFNIEKGETEEGMAYLQGTPTYFYNAFMVICRDQKLPRFFRSVLTLGQLMGDQERNNLRPFGWKRTLHHGINGTRFYRYELFGEQIH